MLSPDLRIEEIVHRKTLSLRRELVVPGSVAGVLHMAEDDSPLSRHHGLFRGNHLVGVVSSTPQVTARRPAGAALRFYAMAVHRELRCRGIGLRLLRHLASCARQYGAAVLWANARLETLDFYRRAGFIVEGQGSVNPVTGLMSRVVLRDLPTGGSRLRCLVDSAAESQFL